MADKKLPQTIEGYEALLAGLKERTKQAQVKAGLAVNQELISPYWAIGRNILIQESQQGWGAKVVDRLARDPKSAFPEMKGFSARNLPGFKNLEGCNASDTYRNHDRAPSPSTDNICIIASQDGAQQPINSSQ